VTILQCTASHFITFTHDDYGNSKDDVKNAAMTKYLGSSARGVFGDTSAELAIPKTMQ
jgi:hypothetical protein